MLKILRGIWGDLSDAELKKFSLLSLIITVILGNYWMLRSLKKAVFNELVGMEHEPIAKILSIFVVALMVSIYSKLVDIFKKKSLFDILCVFYGSCFLIFSIAYANVDYFMMSPDSSFYDLFSWIKGKSIGWMIYFMFESSSLMIILFWAFVASITIPESAKRGYPMIVAFIQVGTISGPAIVTAYSETWGIANIILLGAILTFAVPFLVRLFFYAVPKNEIVDHDNPQDGKADKKKPKTGFFEGLKIIATRPYVVSVLVVSTVYEIVATIIEYQMNMIAKDVYTTTTLATFHGKYGMSINALAMVFALLGTSFFMRRYGLRFCLISYPTLIGVVLISLLGFKYLGADNITIMWALFGSMVAIKGLSYALNNPTKEVMYIPTSKDVRFKAKGWIESFGGRSSKGVGSAINNQFVNNLNELLLFGTLISLGIVGAWIIIANYLGKKYNQLQENNTIIS